MISVILFGVIEDQTRNFTNEQEFILLLRAIHWLWNVLILGWEAYVYVCFLYHIIYGVFKLLSQKRWLSTLHLFILHCTVEVVHVVKFGRKKLKILENHEFFERRTDS